MRLTSPFPRFQLALALLVACAASGCNVLDPRPVALNVETAGSFSINVNQEIDIHFVSTDAASYAVPPAFTGSALKYVAVTYVYDFAEGAEEIFHFKSMEPGTAVITFTRISECCPPSSVTDTVTVR
jgi:hypothetical protein